ncbi:MAG TPA: Na/Pi symporter [Chitinophagales bacterium]|nr:Na/Pi symporter [Chitinophagales bacterium]HMZ90172.1 Na/Pi symporter [Chitinophagales bacterium]HNE45435.1 Na/Pi symporter [Chitinophagales bacterium]
MGLNIGLLLGGIGVFVFGIQLLEKALRSLMSRRFKLFLRRQTGRPFRAVFGGTVLSAALQSSSVVNFLVLAFAGSGIISLKNALAVIMGTNLGTTLNSWIVATIGFRLEIEMYALPVAGVAGLLLFVFPEKKFSSIARFFMGFSFLFIGLGFMQQSVQDEAIIQAMSRFRDSGAFVFLILGFIATTITQSSAATVAITLSLLYASAVGFSDAMAIVIGSEVGTSVKLILGALDGVPVKKRISVGNFMYNLVTTIVAFALLRPAEICITEIMHVRDPLIGLAVFQTGMNLMSIILFFPFLSAFSNRLEKSFNTEPAIASLFITPHTPVIPDGGLELLKKETGYFIHACMSFNAHNFHLHDTEIPMMPEFAEILHQRNTEQQPLALRYMLLKEQYGEIQSYYIRLKSQNLEPDDAIMVEQLIAGVRSAMYASKCIKDLFDDLHEWQNSADEQQYGFLKNMRIDVRHFYMQLTLNKWQSAEGDVVSDELLALLKHAQQTYQHNIEDIYRSMSEHHISDTELATRMNFNRELFTSSKSMIMSCRSYLLDPLRAEKFNEIPTYIP